MRKTKNLNGGVKMNAIEVINQIKDVAKQNSNRHKSQKTRFITEDKISIGECFRVGFDHPIGAEVKRNQIADGVSVGARHVLNGKFKVYDGVQKPFCLNAVHAKVSVGYVFDAEETTVLGHPEHDNYVFKFPCRWQVVHQLDLRILKRAAD
jgi:hypothetical protein